jgi:hypothetical protein
VKLKLLINQTHSGPFIALSRHVENMKKHSSLVHHFLVRGQSLQWTIRHWVGPSGLKKVSGHHARGGQGHNTSIANAANKIHTLKKTVFKYESVHCSSFSPLDALKTLNCPKLALPMMQLAGQKIDSVYGRTSSIIIVLI